MEYQSFGRHQRPKGANIKQALQAMLLLALCTWLGYQIKNPRNKTENYGGQIKLVLGYEAMALGRKGTPSRLDERAFLDSGNEDSAGGAKESSSGRDDEYDGAKEDKAEEEFGHINDKFRTNEGKEMELEPERQSKVSRSPNNKYKESSKIKSGKVYIESRRSDSDADHKKPGNKKYPKIPFPVIRDSQSNDKEIEVQLREPPNDVQVRMNATSDFSMKGIDEDEDPRIRGKETETLENVGESATNAGVTERIDGVLSFHDENGVPPDGSETELVVGQARILHDDNISNFSKGIRPGKSNIYEVTSGEEHDLEMTLEASKNDATADVESNTGSVTHVDTSGINRSSEIGEGDGLVL